MKQFLRQAGLIWDDDMSLEVIAAPKINARFIQMRAKEALYFLEKSRDPTRQIRRVDGVIAWIDQMREYISYNETFDNKDLTWFFKFWSEETRDWLIRTDEKIPVYDLPFVLDDGNPTKIQAFVSQSDIQNVQNIQSLWKRPMRRAIATPYPTLVKRVLTPMEDLTWDDMVCFNIDEVSGKTEALVAAWFYNYGIDVVDTGETLKRNWLVAVGEPLFESYPAGIVSASQLEQDTRLQDVVRILTDASNNAYYNSPNYRTRYPRG